MHKKFKDLSYKIKDQKNLFIKKIKYNNLLF